MDADKERELRQQILDLVAQYYRVRHQASAIIPGQSKIAYAGRVFDEREMQAATGSVLDFFLTYGEHGEAFERRFAECLGLRFCAITNSGSSANLIAVASLCSDMYGPGLQPGSEVITPAVTFPTTVNAIVQNRLKPVFVDVDPATYNADLSEIRRAIGPDTKLLLLPHTLGNVSDMDAVTALCREHGLLLIEDCCDALGSRFKGRSVGTFGAFATFSFYPAHHMTMGEGGAVCTNDPKRKRIMTSLRDWGRDCWCATGVSDTCGKRFAWQLGDLPAGYDHKYTYSTLGYNLKPLDVQAAIGLQQLDKLPDFERRRRENFERLLRGLRAFDTYFQLPEELPGAEVCWFAFPLTVRESAPFSRNQVTEFLEGRRIETRLLFAGNLIRQPAYKNVPYRVVGDLKNSDRVMERSFFIGVYPGLDDSTIDYVLEAFADFLRALPH